MLELYIIFGYVPMKGLPFSGKVTDPSMRRLWSRSPLSFLFLVCDDNKTKDIDS